MNEFGVLVELIAVVVALGGAAKVVAPRAFAELTTTMGLPVGQLGARLVGLAEVALGVWVLAVGGRIACAVLAVTYLAFAVVVVLARRAGAESCGCFGAAAAPPSVIHVVVNGASAAIAAVAALVGGYEGIASTLADQPLAGVPFLLLLGTGAWLLVSLDTIGAAAFDSIGQVAKMGPVFRENATRPATTARTTVSQHDHRSDPRS